MDRTGKGHIDIKELVLALILVVALGTSILFLKAWKKEVILESQQSSNNTQQTLIEAVQDNTTTQAPAKTPTSKEIPTALKANKTMEALLDEGLGRADSRFYKTLENGTVHIETARWSMMRLNESPDSIPLKENDLRASEIRFNGRYIDSLRGFAFNVYEIENATVPQSIYGTAVFLGQSTPLDNINGSLIIQYDPHPRLSQVLEGCTILSSQDLFTLNETALKIYDFRCSLMYGAWI